MRGQARDRPHCGLSYLSVMRLEIPFTDEEGRRWTVSRAPGRIPGVVTLTFATEGQRRSCEAVVFDDDTWMKLGEPVCRLLVRGARPE
jgi:hypothetical protein